AATCTYPGSGGIAHPLFPVSPAQAVTAGAGPRWGRKDAGRRRTSHRAPILKSPFFFGFQKPFLFPAGKKKWVLKASFSPVILRPQAVESAFHVFVPFCHAQRREIRILRFAQNDKGGTPCSLLFTPSVRQSRTAP